MSSPKRPGRRKADGPAAETPLPACSPIVIERVSPALDGGLYPVKRLAGSRCEVEATVFRDGHAVLIAVVRWRRAGRKGWSSAPLAPANPGLDLWRGSFPLDEPGRYRFLIEAWTDRYGSWLADLRKRVEGGQPDVRSEALEGMELLREGLGKAAGVHRTVVETALAALDGAGTPAAALAAASGGGVPALLACLGPGPDASCSAELEVAADRPLACCGAWYEMFPRSQGSVPGKSGTFLDAEARLPDLQAMGFDVVYLPPIHPIGRTARKGRNNSLACGREDPGSPWAIGNEAGGHTAVEPSLGTLADFDRFAAAARSRSMEVALDLALQCSPDHPWVEEHPAWFQRRPDGSIKYAENPPKKYQDIYPLDFSTADRSGLWREMLRVVRFWIGHGVRIFRVDNPHTKPLPFWRWLIGETQAEDPGVIFLAEAFTRPPMMHALAKAGFTQSYTYFTWRHTKRELTDYALELADGPGRDYFRPNFFANTPDILPPILQTGGPPAFRLRLVLAATLSPSYGIYSGFELCENAALPGREEYLDSEKYEIKPRDWDRPGNIKDLVAAVNRIRRENPALRELSNVRFLPADNENILFFSKSAADGSNTLLIAVNLDPSRPQACTVAVPADLPGLPRGSFAVKDLLDGQVYRWGERNYVRLDPAVRPAHILRVEG
ncbi:MAG: alpha-1,4-glucan--maltose-1-phosphate maltosyltransferase [Elusimicrobia bacterium]|nr:alpha-1,4-glucan--maltose-1-phosphate maltosyltransferase [Elusimicrobiota bacterium]